METHCLGCYPKWFAYGLRWIVNRNPKRTVYLEFRGRIPKRGYNYGWGGRLKLKYAKRISIYVHFNIHAPINKKNHYYGRLRDEENARRKENALRNKQIKAVAAVAQSAIAQIDNIPDLNPPTDRPY